LGMLNDAEFNRAIAIAILHPIMLPRVCPCGGLIDPAAFHLLHCKHIHYGIIHDRVKEAVAARLRSFMTVEAASLSVLLEQQMDHYFARRNPAASNLALQADTALIADMVVSLHGDLQQTPIACDFVSCLARSPAASTDFTFALADKAALKIAKYSRYAMPSGAFFPLPFGRTNVLSKDVLSFCSLVHSHFPPLTGVDRKLRATFSRAIYAGVSQSFNLGVRRLQLASTWRVPVPLIPLPVLMQPYERVALFDPPIGPRRPSSAAAVWQPYAPNVSPAMANRLSDVFASRLADALAPELIREADDSVRASGNLIGTAVPADASSVWSNHSTCVVDSRLSAALDAAPAPELGGAVVLGSRFSGVGDSLRARVD